MEDLKKAASGLLKRVEPPKPTTRKRSDTDTVRHMLYLHPAVYRQLRAIAYTREVQIQAVLRDAIDCLFRSEGMPLIAELTPPPAEGEK